MSKITTRKSAKRLTPAAAKRAARAALDIVLLNIAVSVGSKASGDKLLRSIKRGAKRGDVLQAVFFVIASPVFEAREHLLTA